MSANIHDTQTCTCEMCQWADRQEQVSKQRDFSALLNEWANAGSSLIQSSPSQLLGPVTDLVLMGNRLLLESNLLGQIEAFKTVDKQRVQK